MGRLIDVDDVIAAIAKLQQVATIPRPYENDLVFMRDAIEALYREIIKRRFLDEMYDGALDEFQTEEILRKLPPAQPDNRLSKIAELVEGTIDHFDLDDAMDLLYQIKEVVGNETSNI